MSQRATLFCKIESIFEVKGGGEAVLLKDMRSGLTEQHYIADKNDIPSSTFVELPAWMKGDKIVAPDILTPAWKGDPAASSRQLRSQYLAHLYAGPLYNGARGGPDKKFDPETVFSNKTLRMLETIHDRLNEEKLHDLLVATNYRHERKAVYTRFHGGERSYSTPRLINYYPLVRTVKVVWALGGIPEDIEVPVGENQIAKVETAPVKVNIIRIYKDAGWTSLRDEMQKDPKLDSFVRMFYGNGYGVHETPDHPASKRNR
jgi:hypothetical protein